MIGTSEINPGVGARHIDLVEVGPRDGLQPIETFIPTPVKIDLIRRLYDAGVRRMEATAFVSDVAVPQMADAAEVLAAAQGLPGLDVQVLVPNARHAARAVAAGAAHLAFVVSVSEKHNRNNVRRSPAESVEELSKIVAAAGPEVRFRVNIATAFDCPYDGAVDPESTIRLLESIVVADRDVEIALCDTTGRATPDRVGSLLQRARELFRQVSRWAFHGHDTYGTGMANVVAAVNAGVKVIDASCGGLGGCPYAPGATGNVATEDVVWTFDQMNIETGIDLGKLIDAASRAAAVPGAQIGGRVRAAVHASAARASKGT